MEVQAIRSALQKQIQACIISTLRQMTNLQMTNLGNLSHEGIIFKRRTQVKLRLQQSAMGTIWPAVEAMAQKRVELRRATMADDSESKTETPEYSHRQKIRRRFDKPNVSLSLR